MTRLTQQEGWHDVAVAPAGGAWVDTWSTINDPPVITVRRADGTTVTVLDAGTGAELGDYRRGRSEFLTVPAADGTALPAVITRPPDFDPARRYPVLIYVYGGPHAQNVRNGWGGTRGLWHQYMATQGYLVWTLDNRGAWGRGHAWETPIHRSMGKQELADQLSGVAWLKSQPWVDGARIGIWGWSYGGYMTLFALCNAPGKFKMGVSVAPVTDWKDYDTIYTERYMELPADNAEGYRVASPVNQAASLADPLLLVHGAADDNVHMQNSVHMLDALVKAKRPVEFMLYPRKNHGILGKDARTHLFEKITAFVKEHL
jgi:dipeptidyl-peptidase-4